MVAMNCLGNNFFYQLISCKYDGIFNIGPYKCVNGDPNTHSYIEKYMCFIKSLIKIFNPRNHFPKYMLLDCNSKDVEEKENAIYH